MAPFSRSPDGGPSLRLALPRLNRDLIAVIAIIGFVTAGLGLVYGVSVLQFLINGFVVGSIYILGATGLSLIFGIRKFANFSHGEMMAFGAYMAWIVNTIWLLDILVGLILAVVATALLGMTLELLVFRKLADKGPVSALVASIGITIFLQNFIAAIFGTSVQAYNLRVAVNYVLLADNNGVAVLSINPIKGVATLVLASVLILFLHFLLRWTTLGKSMRATADNPDLARASGIRTRNVILWTWAIGGGMAAIAGVLLGIVKDIRPTMGFDVLLFVFAAVIIGGLGSPYGAMVGGLIVGIAGELSTALLAWLGRPDVLGLEQPQAYSPAAAFAILILVLLLRPNGIAGGRGVAIRAHAGWLRLPRLPWRSRGA